VNDQGAPENFRKLAQAIEIQPVNGGDEE